jgi:cytochrome c biogenesis factor
VHKITGDKLCKFGPKCPNTDTTFWIRQISGEKMVRNKTADQLCIVFEKAKVLLRDEYSKVVIHFGIIMSVVGLHTANYY